jgi:Mn2+/Fe2+ NRAMP family transporter
MSFLKKLNSLGPGLLFAATAIGVSHLVQSSRAGAEYGYQLIGVVVLANLFKYPFFEYGTRYAAVTGKSIIDGYSKIGKWFLVVFLIMNFTTMFTVAAAVSLVTAGIIQAILPFETNINLVTGLLLFSSVGLLWKGKFTLLEKGIKWMALIMLLTTLLAFILSLFVTESPSSSTFKNVPSLPFIIALMGWMPTALDISTWNSLWTVEKMKKEKFDLKAAKFDFNFGYIFTAVLAVVFLILGARVMSSSELPDSAVGYSNVFLSMFTSTLGNWSWPIIAAAAFTVMLSTTITVLDGYSRAVSHTASLIRIRNENEKSIYRLTLLVLGCGASVLLFFYGGSLATMVNIATIISFLIAPVIAVVNLLMVKGYSFPENDKPKKGMFYLSLAGIVFLIGFSIVYLINL